MQDLKPFIPTNKAGKAITMQSIKVIDDIGTIEVLFTNGTILSGKVAVDGLFFRKRSTQPRCHLVASSIELLHVIAKALGVRESYYENKKGRNQPHYDITEKEFKHALAIKIPNIGKDVIKFLKEHYG